MEAILFPGLRRHGKRIASIGGMWSQIRISSQIRICFFRKRIVPNFDQLEHMENFFSDKTQYPSDDQVNELMDKTGFSYQEVKVCGFYCWFVILESKK